HVYSTLYRTYFDGEEFRRNRKLLTLIPLGLFFAGVLLYAIHPLWFWRTLAYVAVFHFIRQQYGFLRLYAREENPTPLERHSATAVIYAATLYPLLYWHSRTDRDFHWFLAGDFWTAVPEGLAQAGFVVYLGVIALYLFTETRASLRRGGFNLPKNGIVFGTLLSWYLGIVHFNLDLVFTITNVVSHGIPYLALIWVYGARRRERGELVGASHFVSRVIGIPAFFGLLLLFAYVEEGFWAGFVWREHLAAFPIFAELPPLTSHEALSLLVPLLALPQATHYVLDGFIWRIKDPEATWTDVLWGRT
ncbi:MAG: hypothetical protein KF767_07680, partial [Bdellovibrionaceae bacterium]|nr:hypothetical protein [Pseudobdellovibrionaceae bacterium]